MKKLTVMSLAVASIIGTGVLVGTAVASSPTMPNRQDGLVTKLATKFNLNKADVQAVFDEEHVARKADRLAQLSNILQTKVDAGTLTADQKKLIEAKLAEIQKTHEADKSTHSTKSAAERRAMREAGRVSLEKWAADNKIDMAIIDSVMRGGKGGRGGHGRGHDMSMMGR
jgi:hypothetical protein